MKKIFLIFTLCAILSCDSDESSNVNTAIEGLWRVEGAVIYGDIAAIVPYDCQVVFNVENGTVVFDEDLAFYDFAIVGATYNFTGNSNKIDFNGKTFRYQIVEEKLILDNNPQGQDAKPIITLGRIE